MGLALFKEKRLSQRRKLTGLLPGKLTFEGTETEIVGRPVDVSQHGMGFVVAKEIEPGATLVLATQGGKILLQVAWSQPDFGKQDMFRYGFVTVDPSLDLESIFIDGGCLR